MLKSNVFSIFSTSVILAATVTGCGSVSNLMNQGSSLPTFDKLNWDQVEEVHADAVLTGVNIKLRKPEKAIEGVVSVKLWVKSSEFTIEIYPDSIPNTLVGGISGNDLKNSGDISAFLPFRGGAKNYTLSVSDKGTFYITAPIEGKSTFWININGLVNGKSFPVISRFAATTNGEWRMGSKTGSSVEIIHVDDTQPPTPIRTPSPVPTD